MVTSPFFPSTAQQRPSHIFEVVQDIHFTPAQGSAPARAEIFLEGGAYTPEIRAAMKTKLDRKYPGIQWEALQEGEFYPKGTLEGRRAAHLWGAWQQYRESKGRPLTWESGEQQRITGWGQGI